LNQLRRFRLNEISESYSSAGIDEGIDELEENIVKYLKSEFERYTPQGVLARFKSNSLSRYFCIEKGSKILSMTLT